MEQNYIFCLCNTEIRKYTRIRTTESCNHMYNLILGKLLIFNLKDVFE